MEGKSPPDITQLGNSSIYIDRSKSLSNDHDGPRYLIVKRAKSDLTLKGLSPFLIARTIDYVAGGKVTKCTKTRNGDLIILTKNRHQAEKLIQLSHITPEIEVAVDEHPTLNNARGVIYSRDLLELSDDEIKAELKSQRVINIKRFQKHTDAGKIDSGLFLLTFSTSDLPSEIYCGYEKFKIRQYIPPALRCYNCFKFGHPTNDCKNKQICPQCGEENHLASRAEKCPQPANCTNCKTDHNALSRTCPIFIKNKELQHIKYVEKVDAREAYRRYKLRHPASNNTTYSAIVSQAPNKTSESSPTTTTSERQETPENTNMLTPDDINKIINIAGSSKPQKTVSILPRNTNKRKVNAMKQLAKSKCKSTKCNRGRSVIDNNETVTDSESSLEMIE